MDVPQSLYRSLNRLLAFTLFCWFLGATGFALLDALPRPASRPASWLVFACVEILSLGGMLLMFLAAARLRDAVQNERWPVEQTDPWRSRTRSVWWNAALGVSILAMDVAMLAGLRHHGSMHLHMSFYWPAFILVQTLTQVTAAFRKPASSGALPIWRDWQHFGKLESEHWGKRQGGADL